jgi:tRNA pseudouridine38-40 synthase
MARYFIELCYDGTGFGGFQIQANQDTIQGTLEYTLNTFYRTTIALTGASRTDAGVHALQNYFHFDTDLNIEGKHIYNLNAMLPTSIAIKALYSVPDTAHARFDATKRSYIYKIHRYKNPFLVNQSWYYPFSLDLNILNQATQTLLTYTSFETFSKKNTQVNNFNCTITKALWREEGDALYFEIDANRFLRGMIRGLVGTLLQVGRGQITLEQWHEIVLSNDEQRADFSTPAYGLYLSSIEYPNYLKKLV